MSGPGRRWWLALVLALVVVVPGTAGADAPGAEAWFPSGIGTVTAATYPADTLHVGAIAGTETDRTYLRFDGLGNVRSAVLTIPVAEDAGTVAPESAVVAACAVPGGFDGVPETPPEVDCDVAAQAIFDAGALTVDVTALVVGDSLAVALVPVAGDGRTWHVGFDATARDGGAPAELTVELDEPGVVSPTPTTVRPTPIAPPPTLSLPPVTAPTVSPGAAIAEQAAPPPTTVVPVATVATTDGRFAYPIVFALPLVLLVVVALAGDGLTKPVRLREEPA